MLKVKKTIGLNSGFWKFRLTVSIRIVAECGTPNFQFTKKLKRATDLEITTNSAIIFIHCYRHVLFQLLFIFVSQAVLLTSFGTATTKIFLGLVIPT